MAEVPAAESGVATPESAPRAGRGGGAAGFMAPAVAAFVAGLLIAAVGLAAEPEVDLARSIPPAPVGPGPLKVEPEATVVPDDSGIPGVVAWESRNWPGNRQWFPGHVPFEHHEGPIRYPVMPPAGGDHNPRWVNCGVYDQPIPPERAVHAHEHGAVWITYRPDLPKRDVEALEEFVRRQPMVAVTIGGVRRETNERYMILSPFPGQREPVVISSWAHQLRVGSPDDPRLQRFVDTFRVSEKYSPEYGPTCLGQPEALGGRPAFE